MTQGPEVTIAAKDYIDDHRSVVDCATLIGTDIAKAVKSGNRVVLSMRGVRGASSSFFNVVLDHVCIALGGIVDGNRFTVLTDTATQDAIYQRSLAAINKRTSSAANRPAS